MEENILKDIYTEAVIYISVSSIQAEYLECKQHYIELEKFKKDRVKRFSEERIFNFIKAINLSLLTKLVGKIILTIEKDIVNYSKLCLKKDSSFQDIQNLIGSIYVLVENNQKYKEENYHYLRLVKHAISYVKSCKNAFTKFIFSQKDIDKKENKEIIEYVMMDVESVLGVLNDLKSDLSSSGEVISARYNLLMRAESSIRLLSKFQDMDFKGNLGQSRNQTTPKGEGFNIEEV
jgi:hypothetical protein